MSNGDEKFISGRHVEELNSSQDPNIERESPADIVRKQATDGYTGGVEGETPIAAFNKMAELDSLQNRRLSARVNGLASASTFNLIESRNKASRMRFIICILGLISLSMSQMSRMVLNLSVTEMVIETGKQDDDKNKDGIIDDGSCPWPEDSLQENPQRPEQIFMPPPSSSTTKPFSADETEITTTFESSHDDNHPLPSDEPVTTSAPPTTTTLAPDAIGQLTANSTNDRHQFDRFDWSVGDQQLLLGGFYWSYFLFMVLGGRMAEIYGAKYVLLLGVAGSAAINLLTPWMAHTSYWLLLASRVVLGAVQAGVFPAMYALINKWLTSSEASIFAPMIKVSLRLGMVLGSLVPGHIEGWPNVFYFTGGLNLAWSLLWILLATSDPAENRWVSSDELKHINRKKEIAVKHSQTEAKGSEPNETDEEKTPWVQILTNSSVIGLILVKLTFNYALDFLAIQLPSYLKRVHHAEKEKISNITGVMFMIQVFLIVLVGWLAKEVVQRRPFGMSKSTIRKLFQGLASYGLAFALFMLTFNDCNLALVAGLLWLISFLSMFTAGGETMLPYDLSSKYPATIMAIANSVANTSGFTITWLARVILGKQGGSYVRWNLLIYLIAGANLIGGLAFSLLVKAKPIDFARGRKSKKDETRALSLGSDHMVNVELGNVQAKPTAL